MTRLYYLVIPLVLWFFLINNIERFTQQPIGFAPFFYGVLALCAILLIMLPQLHRMSLQLLLAVTLLPYILLEYFFGHAIGAQYLPITVTEISALGLTVVLSTLTGRRLEELQETLTGLMIGEVSKEVEPFGTGQSLLYREIRRARRHQRPLALLAITAADDFLKVSLDQSVNRAPLNRFVEDVQHEIVKKYVFVHVSNLLIEELGDSAIVTQRDEHFVTLLPETGREDIVEIVKNLESVAEEKLGLRLKIGVSTFPDEEVTFETLLQRAEIDMMTAKPTNDNPSNRGQNGKGKMEFVPAGAKNILSI